MWITVIKKVENTYLYLVHPTVHHKETTLYEEIIQNTLYRQDNNYRRASLQWISKRRRLPTEPFSKYIHFSNPSFNYTFMLLSFIFYSYSYIIIHLIINNKIGESFVDEIYNDGLDNITVLMLYVS